MIVTIAERKQREADRRTRAAEEIARRLAEYGDRQGGRFLLYGSAARGTMTYDSDIDLLIDFPEGRLDDAWRFAEQVVAEFDLSLDAMPLAWCKPAFWDRVLSEARSVPPSAEVTPTSMSPS